MLCFSCTVISFLTIYQLVSVKCEHILKKLNFLTSDKTKENESLMRRECKRSRKDDLDGKGYTPEGDDVIMDEHAAKSGNEVNINEKTAEVNTKSGTQATSKKETSTTTQHNRSTSKPVQKIPMVTLVPCPEDTLIMFASLSGMLISLPAMFRHLLFMFYFYLYQVPSAAFSIRLFVSSKY